MNDDEKADRDDAIAHQRWVDQTTTDPHHTRIDNLGHAETQRYLAWHRARLKTVNQTIRILTQPAYEAGASFPSLPLLHQQKAHHEQMIVRLKAMLPDDVRTGGYQKPKQKPLTRTKSTSPDAAAVVRYARLHGITVRQAAHLLTQQPTRCGGQQTDEQS